MKSLATYDFDEDGKDEIYLIGTGSEISRLSDWNAVDQEFDSSKDVFIHSPGLNLIMTKNLLLIYQKLLVKNQNMCML